MSFANTPRLEGVTGYDAREYLKCTSCFTKTVRSDRAAVMCKRGRLYHMPCWTAGRGGILIKQLSPEPRGASTLVGCAGSAWQSKALAMKPEPPTASWCEFCGGDVVEGTCINAGPDCPHPEVK
jgi:hypothetical protein